MKILKVRKIKWVTQDHMATRWQSWVRNLFPLTTSKFSCCVRQHRSTWYLVPPPPPLLSLPPTLLLPVSFPLQAIVGIINTSFNVTSWGNAQISQTKEVFCYMLSEQWVFFFSVYITTNSYLLCNYFMMPLFHTRLYSPWEQKSSLSCSS